MDSKNDNDYSTGALRSETIFEEKQYQGQSNKKR